MEILKNEKLDKYTTFRMGGVAKSMYFPHTIDELALLVNENKNLYKYIISGGSNLLINDKKEFDAILCMKKLEPVLEYKGDGKFYIGSSVRIQNAIKFVNENGYGGMEYLYSLPGLMGGIIYMNAGRGKAYNNSISDFIISVDVLDNGKIITLLKEDCEFGYRKSVFQVKENCIILGGTFVFPEMLESETKKLIEERIKITKNKQDMSAPNFGSVYSTSNPSIIKLAKILGLGFKNGCHFSKKTSNWILNEKEGTFEQALKIIKNIEHIHKIFRRKCEIEVRIWE